MTRLDRYTIYLQNSLETELTDLTVDWLAQDPNNLTLRVFDPNERERRLLGGVAQTVRSIRPETTVIEADDTVGLARALVMIVKTQPAFAQRTARLSKAGAAVRTAIRSADDPHVLLHETLPAALHALVERPNAPVSDLVDVLTHALKEIATIYLDTLRKFEITLLRELGVPGDAAGLPQLRERAERIHGLTGDFRLEALILRLKTYSGSLTEVEAVASLCANKPPRDWSDSDSDRAELEAADLAQRFNRAEAFARVKGRQNGRHSVAFVVGLDRTPELVAREFDITEKERRDVLRLARDIKALTDSETFREEVILAAIAHVGSGLLLEERHQRRPVAANE